MQSVFEKIIKREIPAYIVYEDAKTLAFLDINPVQPGHTLVVPKYRVSRLEDLEINNYNALMSTVQKIMQRQVAVFGKTYRACLKVEGFDVDHAHIHIIPCQTAADFNAQPNPQIATSAALNKMTERLRF